jgi:hypothetical protein
LRDLSAGYDLTVIENGAIAADDLPVSPMLLVQPQSLADRFTVTGTLGAPTISSVVAGNAVLQDVDLSGVTFGETPQYTIPDDALALVSGTGNGTTGPLIWSGALNGHNYVAFAFSIADSNIGQRVAFPILIDSVVKSLTTSAMPLAVSAGTAVTFTPEPETARLNIALPDASERTVTVVPGERGPLPVVLDFTGTSGMYTVKALRADGSVLSTGSFVVNAGDPQESDLTANPDLQSVLDLAGDSAGSSPTSSGRTNDLWRVLAIAVLGILVIEWFVASRVRWHRPLLTGRRVQA